MDQNERFSMETACVVLQEHTIKVIESQRARLRQREIRCVTQTTPMVVLESPSS